jgi:hypothetical protein
LFDLFPVALEPRQITRPFFREIGSLLCRFFIDSSW